MSIKPVTGLSRLTGGATIHATHRLFPQRIRPWSDFAIRQQEFWGKLEGCRSFWSERVYPSTTNLDYVERRIEPIGSEDNLRYMERLTIESMVQDILDRIGGNNEVDESWRSVGSISFENQASFRAQEVDVIRTMQELSIDRDGTQAPRHSRADQFCVVRNKDGIARPIVAIEYKAPHKLTVDEICIGLHSEIWPERDVMDKDSDESEFLCKTLMAAVITQLFSYMIDKGVRYG